MGASSVTSVVPRKQTLREGLYSGLTGVMGTGTGLIGKETTQEGTFKGLPGVPRQRWLCHRSRTLRAHWWRVLQLQLQACWCFHVQCLGNSRKQFVSGCWVLPCRLVMPAGSLAATRSSGRGSSTGGGIGGGEE